jgi:hypothetical protein
MNPVSNLTTSLLLLAIGLTILWLAATNRLSNFINAWHQLAASPGGSSDLTSNISQAIGGPATTTNNLPVYGLPGVTLPVPIPISGQSPSPSGYQLEAGGGLTYHLPQLPSLGTLTQH